MADHWPALDLQIPSQPRDSCSLQDLAAAVLDDFQPSGVETRGADEWRVYFFSPASRDRALDAIVGALGPNGVAATAVEVPDEGWARRSQAGLRAVRVGRIVVAPPWDAGDRQRRSQRQRSVGPDQLSADPLVIVIQPSMGFGTGHHASTRLCLLALQRLDLLGRTVLDLGTGSGVLAIAASRLGAATVVGVDRDPDAIESARDNIRLNAGPGRIEVRLADVQARDELRAAVVIGNLTGALLQRCAGAILRRVEADGHLILGGIGVDEEEQVRTAVGPRAELCWRDTEEHWLAMTFRHRAP